MGDGNGNPLQYSCQENPVDRGAWRAAVQTVAESDITEATQHACIEEGNGNPLRYSCLENPRDRGAWWAAVYGVRRESDTTEATQQQQQWKQNEENKYGTREINSK